MNIYKGLWNAVNDKMQIRKQKLLHSKDCAFDKHCITYYAAVTNGANFFCFHTPLLQADRTLVLSAPSHMQQQQLCLAN